MAWVGASGYAKVFLNDPKAVEPIMVKVNVDGGYGYYSVGFARKDTNIKNLDDMKGKIFAFGDPNSTSGYLIPSIEIPAAGYSMEAGDYFGDIKFSGGHEQTIVGVNNGDFDDDDATAIFILLFLTIVLVDQLSSVLRNRV